ncbi:unnamed protein product [Candidula unifasciata]|uniref:Leucine rich repeat and sterile alpha motif containing 1 n=1 Tax=Candidula unifasciata TaxID=100452 RepID=A0A8S4A0M6_9EUPU|nr:unnamed protein product [Candidula unifasciata]
MTRKMPFLSRKKKGEASGNSLKNSESKRTMPLFRRQSEKCRNRMQDQELLAQQDPEPRFDMSSCELTEVPSGVYAICKVLQKQVLLLHDNWLHGLSGGGDLIDLKLIRVLDLHNNELKSLPEDFGCLLHLQVLDLSSNYLKTLPKAFEDLQSLQTLNIRNNKFKFFPEPILKLRRLRTLDISLNDIIQLPVNLCCVRALETLIFDIEKMKYPSQETCKKSTAAIMMFLCSEAGIEYEHPSKYWLKTQTSNKTLTSSFSDGMLNIAQMESQMMQGVAAYQSVLDQKRKDAQELERLLCAEQEAQTELATRAAEEHRRLLSSITQHQEQDSNDLEYLNDRKEAERNEFLKYLKEIENGASTLLAELLDYNLKAQETEKLMEIMESERMKEENWFTVRWEELENLRKQEILDNMKMLLTDFDSMETIRLDMEQDKDEMRRDTLEQENLDLGQIESLINYKHLEHKKMIEKLGKEEALQKAAFEALLYSQDSAHSRILSQISLIESELAQITAMERYQRDKRVAHEFNVMEEQRVALSAMLSQLLEEKDRRQIELKKLLLEMELQREEGQQDYWLVQYQRFLDRKPQSLIDRENQLEPAVKDILISAGAEDYIPIFARHRITMKILQSLTDPDLRQMGVHEMGLRRSILRLLDHQQLKTRSPREKIRDKKGELVIPSHQATPTAPPEEQVRTPELPPALLERQASVIARGMNSECAVCLDMQSSVIFLTCGHVCCCATCAQTLHLCPLCRATISAKIKLRFPQRKLTS